MRAFMRSCVRACIFVSSYVCICILFNNASFCVIVPVLVMCAFTITAIYMLCLSDR